MFILPLFIIAIIWKQLKYPLADDVVYVCVCVIYKECYSAIKNNKILSFAATWMDLEIIILIEVSQRKTNDMISLICEILNDTRTNLQNLQNGN